GDADDARPGKGDRDPVVAVVAATGGLPALAHDPGVVGRDQVGGRGVEHVAAPDDRAAVLQRGQVERVRGEVERVGDDVPVDAQPGHAAVGVLAQPDVGDTL